MAGCLLRAPAYPQGLGRNHRAVQGERRLRRDRLWTKHGFARPFEESRGAAFKVRGERLDPFRKDRKASAAQARPMHCPNLGVLASARLSKQRDLELPQSLLIQKDTRPFHRERRLPRCSSLVRKTRWLPTSTPWCGSSRSRSRSPSFLFVFVDASMQPAGQCGPVACAALGKCRDACCVFVEEGVGGWEVRWIIPQKQETLPS